MAPLVTSMKAQSDGSYLLAFTNMSGAPFTVLSSFDLSLDPSNWQVLGLAREIHPGQFQFIDSQSAGAGVRFYRVRSP
jgi:hypothetical protein